MGADDDQRVTAFSVQLRRAHQQLRDQLAALQADLGRTGGPASLTVHCLAFCAALTTHHQGEDDGMFGALLRARPDLAPAVGKLREDHAAMAGLLGEARALAERARTAPAESLPALRRQLDGLTAITESHFRYEERAIGAALDEGLADTGWSVAGVHARTAQRARFAARHAEREPGPGLRGGQRLQRGRLRVGAVSRPPSVP